MKIIVLKLNDIREWLNDNCDEYQKLKTLDFPPIDNEVYWMYNNLYEFISFYSYSHKCSKALIELKLISDFNFLDIIKSKT